MMNTRRLRGAAALPALCLAMVLSGTSAGRADPAAAPALQDWPKIASPIAQDPAMERRIARIVAGMSLRQKIGQMTQAEIKAVEPEDVRKYYLGSVLNGGGSWPHMERHAPRGAWVAMADRFYDATLHTDMAVKIPLLWGTDAVHGDNNVFGATLFLHNIGLGAAHDPELISEIGRATGRAVRSTGINWAFAPTVAVVQNERWGRSYEGFAADPMLVRDYAKAYVEGLQGDFRSSGDVVATAKHFMGDGGTANGRNEGVNEASKAEMINVHAQGYYGALSGGVQTVMASYSSWNDVAAGVDYGRMHASRVMLTDVLKAKMGFDGFVVSDWDGIDRVPGCTRSHCPQAINAGVDMVMVPMDWREFIDNTVKDVETGAIPMSRIDDAVTRILRVKMRAGLFGRRPSADPLTHTSSALQARALARRAVRESLVLLKNDNEVLPLKRGMKVLVVGKNADSLPDQVGGWSLTWQGSDTTNADFPQVESVLAAIRAANAGGSVVYSPTGRDVDASRFDVVVAVIGETPYAETAGDVAPPAPLAHSVRFPEDLAALQAVSGKGPPVVTVFESGRTVYANDLLNASTAFVAAWLPGSEGRGVTDVLFRRADGAIGHDFRGALSFSWPASACPRPGSAALFPTGYGLTYASALPAKVGPVWRQGSAPAKNSSGPHPSMGALPVEIPTKGCP